jgi:tetratricopeptide (TPR) repeat protein
MTDKLNILCIHLSGIFNRNKKKHDLHLFFARQKMRIEDLAGAIQELNKSISYSHGLNEAANTLINIYFYQKDFRAVYDCFNRLPEFKDLKKWVFDLAINSDELEHIPSGLANSLSLALDLSRYYYHIGEYRKAADIYRVIDGYFMNDFYNNYNRGLSHLGLGDNERALDYFRSSFQHLHHQAVKLRLEEMIRVFRIVSDTPQT